MAVTITSAVYTVMALWTIQKLLRVFYRYACLLELSRRITALPKRGFILGDLWADVDTYMAHVLNTLQTTRTKMHTFWVYFLYPVFFMDHPDTARVILKSTNMPKDNTSVGAAYAILRPWIGDGLLTNQGGEKWHRNRHMLTPAFHFDILKGYVEVFNDVAEDLLVRLSQFRDGSMEVCGPVCVAALDALLRCAFSFQDSLQEQGFNHPFVAAITQLADISTKRFGSPMLYPDFVFFRTRMGREFQSHCEYVHAFAEQIIAKRRAYLESMPPSDIKDGKRDFLDILILAKDDSGRGLSDSEIRDEADTVLFAGHDTTSSAISFCLYSLALYPDMQEKVYSEVLSVVGSDRVQRADLAKLTYTTYFIKETMRMYSTVPMVDRRLAVATTVDGVTIPAGSTVTINIHGINHHPEVWPDHMVFRPERFIESDVDKDPFTYIPFSAGNRNCIGQNFAQSEIKVFLARIVQTFRIVLDPNHKVEQHISLVMKTLHGIKVFLRSR